MRALVRLLTLSAILLLAACGGGQKSAPGAAPANLTATAGDGIVLLTWDQQPGLDYWVFFQAGSSVSAASITSTALMHSTSPRAIGGLTNGTQYAFVMNATQSGSPAGPASNVVTATPRLAGASWTVTNIAGQSINGIANGSIVVNNLLQSTFVAGGDKGTLLVGAFSYPAATGVTAWAPPTTVPAGYVSDIVSVVYSGSNFIAMGSDGTLLTSTDTQTWTAGNTIASNGVRLNRMVYLLGTYFVVGNGGLLMTSTDLTNWTTQTTGTTADLYNLGYANGSVVALGDKGTLLTSSDAITWTAQTTNTTAALRALVYGLPASATTPFAIVVGDAVNGAATMITSTDLATWTGVNSGGTQSMNAVVYGSRFMAVGNKGAVLYSDDGATWTAATAGSANLTQLYYGTGLYMALGAGGMEAVAK